MWLGPRPDKRPDLDSAAIITTYKSGASAASLARQYHTTIWSIINRLKKAGVWVRSNKEQNEHRLGLPDDRIAEFIGMVDGLVLGDGHINSHGSLEVVQIDKRREWLEHIASHLAAFGIRSRITPRSAPKRMAYIGGRQINAQASSVLRTPCYVELKEQRARWYPNGGHKQVPADVTMTPLGLAYWFCGDGTGGEQGLLTFCTHSFSESAVRLLAEKLAIDFNITCRCAKVHRPPDHRTARAESEFIVVTSGRDVAQRFKDLTEEHIPTCCLYKFKHVRPAIRRGSVGARLSQEKVNEIRERYAAGGVAQTTLAADYGVTQAAISQAVRGKIYRGAVQPFENAGVGAQSVQEPHMTKTSPAQLDREISEALAGSSSKQPLYGHTNEATAYVVADYPYGYTMRCTIRHWLEHKPHKGWRFVSQTKNPKTDRWNKPKASTYADWGGAMFLDSNDHVHWDGVGPYSDASKILAFVQAFPGADMSMIRKVVPAKIKLVQDMLSGKRFFTINGVKQARSEADDARNRKDLELWEEVSRAL